MLKHTGKKFNIILGNDLAFSVSSEANMFYSGEFKG